MERAAVRHWGAGTVRMGMAHRRACGLAEMLLRSKDLWRWREGMKREVGMVAAPPADGCAALPGGTVPQPPNRPMGDCLEQGFHMLGRGCRLHERGRHAVGLTRMPIQRSIETHLLAAWMDGAARGLPWRCPDAGGGRLAVE